jgi:hypothetical protein
VKSASAIGLTALGAENAAATPANRLHIHPQDRRDPKPMDLPAQACIVASCIRITRSHSASGYPVRPRRLFGVSIRA